MQLNTSGRDLTESAIAGPWHRNLHFNHRIQPTSVSDKLELLLVVRQDEDNIRPGRFLSQAYSVLKHTQSDGKHNMFHGWLQGNVANWFGGESYRD